MDRLSKELTDVLENYSLRKLKKGQTLLFQGEIPRYAYVIRDGIIKTFNITPLGEEQIISLGSSGDIVPEAWLLGEASVAYYFYEAFTDCELFVLPREELIKLVDGHPQLSQQLLRQFMRLYVGSTVHINALEQSKSRDKIIHLLHYLLMRFGSDIKGDTVTINFRLTHQTLADMIGLTRETIATELSKLRRQKVITYRGQIYTINKNRLLHLRNEEDLIQAVL